MSIEVLLMKDMDNLGEEGSVVKVADGYARNCLFPQQLAEPVTDAARRRLEKLRKEREEIRKATLADAKKLKAKIEEASITIKQKTTDGENLYGSVTAADVVKAFADAGIELGRDMVKMDAPFKTLGSFDIELKVHQDVTAAAKIWIVEE